MGCQGIGVDEYEEPITGVCVLVFFVRVRLRRRVLRVCVCVC